MPTVSASFGLGLGCYAPALALASLLAWPERPLGLEHERYAINRWAFLGSRPRARRLGLVSRPRAAAASGSAAWSPVPASEVEWSGRALRVDGQPLALEPRSAPEGRRWTWR